MKSSFSFYAPYPGSALGHQLIAEGRSLMTNDNYHRFPDDEKVKGIDYQFYREMLAGRYDDEILAGIETDAKNGDTYLKSLTKA